MPTRLKLAQGEMTTDDLLAAGLVQYQPKSKAARVCRVSVRRTRAKENLILAMTNEIATQANIAIGQDVRIFADPSTITIVPSDGNVRVRRQGSSGDHPYIMLAIGPDCLFSQVDIKGSVPCEHSIDKHGRLRLSLPPSIKLTLNV
jgi:hypothetical protein